MNTYEHINGLHEIHISVDPNQIALLRLYCKDSKIKPICATALQGDHPNQLMISKWKNGTSPEVIQKAHDLEKDMTNYGLKVLRVKVEAMMHTKGCPTNDEKPLRDGDYWEFHLKLSIDHSNEYHKLEQIVAKHKGGMSFNVFKRELEPLVTLRLYKRSYNEAMQLKADLIEDIQRNGFVCNGGIQQEFSVYDTFTELDKGWLPGVEEF